MESETSTLDGDQLLQAIRHDCVSFMAMYIGEDLTIEVPDVHIYVWNELLVMVDEMNKPGVVRQLKKLFAIPREHSKSTLSKLAVILILKYTPLRFCVYASKTNGIAKNAIRDILMWLESPQENQLFGPARMVKTSETESLWIVDIAIRASMNQEPEYKRVILKALGAEQQVRGMLIMNRRPEVVIIDDIEDLDNTTPDQQTKLDEWFLGSFRKSWGKNCIIIFIGNMIRKTTLLARLAKDPEWNPTVFGAIIRDEHGQLRPLWPGRWTLEALLKEYQEFIRLGRGYIWEAEMMNLTQDEIFQGNFANVVRPPHPNPEDLEYGCIVLDPAFGLEVIHDSSAIAVHVKVKNVPMPVVIDSVVGKFTEDEMFDHMLDLSYRYGLTTWFIEAEAAQALLISYFTLLMQTRKISSNLFLLIPITTGKKSKVSRILMWRNSVTSGSYGIDDEQNDLMDELIAWVPDETKHEDRLDAGAYGVKVWELFDETVRVQGIKQVAMLAHGDGVPAATQHGVQVAGF